MFVMLINRNEIYSLYSVTFIFFAQGQELYYLGGNQFQLCASFFESLN